MTDVEIMTELVNFFTKKNISPYQGCHCMATLILRLAAEQQTQESTNEEH